MKLKVLFPLVLLFFISGIAFGEVFECDPLKSDDGTVLFPNSNIELDWSQNKPFLRGAPDGGNGEMFLTGSDTYERKGYTAAVTRDAKGKVISILLKKGKSSAECKPKP